MSCYESHNLENDELPFIYRERVLRPSGLMPGSANWHENFELIYITDGEGCVSNNGRIIRVSAGDVILINSNHLHSLAAGEGEMSFRYLIVDRAFCLANGIDTSSVTFETCIRDGAVYENLAEIHKAYSIREGEQYRTAAVRYAVLGLMLGLCKNHSTPSDRTNGEERSLSYVKRAIDYIRASYDKSFSLEDAAVFVGVNKCYLSREFHRYTGVSFVDYVNRTRCKMAQRMLVDTQLNIYEVGRLCGFENRSYFSKTFQKYVGMLPGEYRAAFRV